MLWAGKLNAPARAWYEKLGGAPLGEKSFDMDGVDFSEVAFGWMDLRALFAQRTSG